MSKARWKPFPHADKHYDYAGARLKSNWSRLHQGDREPYPSVSGLKKLVELCPEFAPSGSLEEAAVQLEDAWRAYHRGEFRRSERRRVSRRVAKVEGHEVECRSECRVIETREFRHLEVVVPLANDDFAVHPEQHGHRELAAPFWRSEEARRVLRHRWRKARRAGTVRAVAHRAVRLERRRPVREAWLTFRERRGREQ